MDELQTALRGNRPDYVLGTSIEGWDGPAVVRFRAREGLSRLSEHEITLRRLREEGPFPLTDLLDAPVTLRIATEGRWRQVHGIVAQVEELERTSELELYRVLLVPAAYRATQRVRSRTFVDQTLRQILVHLLENRSIEHPLGFGGLAEKGAVAAPEGHPSFDAFAAPAAFYRFAVGDAARLDDPKLRDYVVQYNESDYALFCRLLEEEGLSFYFDQQDDGAVLTITDRPGASPYHARDRSIPFRGAMKGVGARDRESIRTLRAKQKLLWGSVEMRDYDPARPQAPRLGMAIDDVALGESNLTPEAAIFHQRHYPSRDEQVSEPGVRPATVLQERRAAERSLKDGVGTTRVLEPGLRFSLRDDTGVRKEEELVVVSVTTFATQLLPEDTVLDDEPFGLAGRRHDAAVYECAFEALPVGVVFRPPLATPRPRIDGVHTAVVAADEVEGTPPEIHRDDLGRVRVRFPWDERLEPGKPSSTWIRVSQGWAGAGYGHLFVPRVGHEVLVAYMAGDPEKPLIVGRVHNAIQPVAYEKPTISTIKSKSSPNSDGFNELRFDDDAGNEEIFLHAQKNLNETVLASHSTSVGGDQSNSVGGKRSHSVKGTESVDVTGDRTTTFGANETHTVAGHRESKIGVWDALITPRRSVHATDHYGLVAGNSRSEYVGGTDKLEVTGPRTEDVAGLHLMRSASAHMVQSPSGTYNHAAAMHASSGGAHLFLTPGVAVLSSGGGASITLTGDKIILHAATISVEGSGGVNVTSGSAIKLDGGGTIDAKAGTIKLNG